MVTTGDHARSQDQNRAVNALLIARERSQGNDPVALNEYEQCQERVLQAFAHLIRHIAKDYASLYSYREATEDLAQVGAIGMLTAMQEFDPERGTPFGAFAVTHIQFAIRRHLRDNAWGVHVPRGAKERRAKVASARVALTDELGRAPTIRELATRLDATEEEVLQAVLADNAAHVHPLDFAPDQIARETGYDEVELRHLLVGFLAGHSPQDRQILTLRMTDQLSQREIAQRLGLSPSHVSRRLTELRRQFTAHLNED